MKNALKIRLIHSKRYSAETEYILEFFRFIGCLIYDESFDETTDMFTWQKHLNLKNEKDGVDIVLNYYGKYPINVCERIYLYFSLEERTCEVLRKPLSEKCIKKYPSKKVTRQTALAFLIDSVWNNDATNQQQIQRIREIYTPTNGERDLFYILQEKGCFDVSKKSLIPMAPYVKKMLEDLWKVYCMFEGNNPYIGYAKINTEIHLAELLNQIDRKEIKSIGEIQYNGQKLNIDRLENIILKLNRLIKDNPWFITMYFLKAYIFFKTNGGDIAINYYESLIRQLTSSGFHGYYSDIFYHNGLCYLRRADTDLNSKYASMAMANFKNAIKSAPQNYDAISKIIFIHIMKVEDKAAESIAMRLKTIDEKQFELFSFKKLKSCYDIYSMMLKISIQNEKEWSAKDYAQLCNSIFINFYKAQLVREISDDEETYFQSFIEFHIKSPTIYALVQGLKLQGEITNQKFKFVEGKLAELEKNQSN